MEESTIKDVAITVRQGLGKWFQYAPGSHLLEMELRLLQQRLPALFGYHLVQIGNTVDEDLLSSSRISHKLIMQLEADGEAIPRDAALLGTEDSLPLRSDSVDVVLVPHVLEFSENPHGLLREVERVLIGDGHLVLVGFNPWSLFGLWRSCLAWREQPPWCGHFYGLARIKDWLSLLDFEIVSVEKFFYRPPLKKIKFLQKLSFLEKLGKYCWPFFGAAYLIVAKKRVIPLTSTKLRWHSKRRMIAAGVTEPSARIKNS